MKRKPLLRMSVLTLIMIISVQFSSAQAPSLINYQVVIRDNNGVPVAEADKSIKLTILQGSETGSSVYTETHAAHTNILGLVNLKIGSITPGIENIDWQNGPFFLKVEVDGTDMGTTQIVSVPYAIFAEKAANGFKGDSQFYIDGNIGIGTNDPKSTLSVVGTTPNDSAIFEVKNNNGNTVFAVYNEGVRIYVDETTKASKGGFAIGGIGANKGTVNEYMRVSGDSIRMYISNSTGAKGAKGGFAIGGYDNVKAANARYMNISSDEGSASGYNTFLGYKAGGTGSGGVSNIAIGYYSGFGLDYADATLGRDNIIIGDSAGLYNNYGYQNIYIGKRSGAKAFAGYHNVYIGYLTGSEGHGQYNVFVGDEAGRYNNNGWSNVFLGNAAGRSVTNGYQNTLIGTQSGWKIGTGRENTFLGSSTGFNSVNSNGNTFIGSQAGDYNVSGNDNVYIGKWAGMQATGSRNIFIGANAGYSITTGDDQLIIDNNASSALTTALISGNFATDELRFNANVSVKTGAQSGYAFYVLGTAGGSTAWSQSSDARLKTNIRTIADPIDKVMGLRGVTFEWKDPDKFSMGEQIGFLAQETMNTLPEVVNTKGEYYSMQYAPITALLVEAVKELKKENDELRSELSRIDELETQIEALKTLVMAAGSK